MVPGCIWGWVKTYYYILLSILMGWTSIYQLFWGSLGARVLTNSDVVSAKYQKKNKPRAQGWSWEAWRATSWCRSWTNMVSNICKIGAPMKLLTVVEVHRTVWMATRTVLYSKWISSFWGRQIICRLAMVIHFHSYVELPEGTCAFFCTPNRSKIQWFSVTLPYPLLIKHENGKSSFINVFPI
jgi:hypothetical protein